MTRFAHTPLEKLLNGPMRPGELAQICVRPARNAPVVVGNRLLIAGRGIEGDHYHTERNGPRQVTLIAIEDIAAIASFLGIGTIEPGLLRRNIVTRGINLLALKNRRFRIGSTVLEGSGECAPCSRMEGILGLGGYNATRGHGGITARVIEGGVVDVGDAIERID